MLIREMTAEDCRGAAEVRVRGWQYAYARLLPQEYLDELSIEEDAELRRAAFAGGTLRDTHLVAEEPDGRIVGWACFGASRDDNAPGGPPQHRVPGDGELLALYVRPERIGTGVGRALTGEVLRRSGAAGYAHLVLWVLEGNVRARRFYGKAGFAADGGRKLCETGGSVVPEVRYRRPLP